jgi:hypothetical protein
MAGFIKNELVNIILNKIDKHKGIRVENKPEDTPES